MSLKRYPHVEAATLSLLVAIVVVFAVVYLNPRAHAQNQIATAAHEKQAEFVPGELLVRFRPGSAAAKTKSKSQLSMTSGGRNLRVEVNHFGGSELVDGLKLARAAPENTMAALNALRGHPDVVYAELNYIRHFDAVPNDTLYASQWALKNASPGGGGISAESAWDTTTGSNTVVVGVIDSGIDINHRDLKDNIFVNTAETPGNNIDDDGNGYVDDVNGWDFVGHDRTVFDNANDDAHGTHVAGIIGARGNNSAGIAGVNWNVQIMPLKALGPQGGTDATLLEAYNYAKAMKQHGVNLRVLNNSYGGQQFSQSLLDGIKQLGDAGILFIAAAGNDGLNNDVVAHFPATYDLPNVISVASSTSNGLISFSFSNQGPQTVHLAAPGLDIISTTPHGYTGEGLNAAATEADGSTYSTFTGTSMATPHVAGAAALALGANPNISLEKLRAAVLFGVDESGGFTNVVITGGRLNANKTVQFASENDTTAPATPGNFRINSQNARRIELRWNEAGDDGLSGRAALDEIRFTDSVSGEQFRLHSTRAQDPGTERTVFVSIPIKHQTGQLTLRTFDNVGNSSTANVSVTIALNDADPYTVTLGAAAPLTAANSGTAVGIKGDDVTLPVSLPFAFPFFGFTTTSVFASTNGTLYVPIPPDFALPKGNDQDVAFPGRKNLDNLAMIAGMWADLRTDRNPTDNIYMVQPDLDRVILRWQGVTFGAETPVSFEIEIRRDGTIQTRYGDGNQNLRPVIVGISGGDPDAYLVGTHSSENAPLSLTNAQSVTFALRNPPPVPTTDLEVTMTGNPSPVFTGQNLTYNIRVKNLGPSQGTNVVMTDVLPAGTTFVSCTSNFISGTCTNSAGTVTGRVNTLEPVPFTEGVTFTLVVQVTAAAGTALQNTASATSFRADPNASNNSASVTTSVVAQSFFGSALAVSAGGSHTTSLNNDGTVWAWGSGQSGELGDGGIGPGVQTLTPVQVTGLNNVTAISAGRGCVYALKSDGTVWAWGSNSSGQLGDGTTTNRSHPVQVNGLTNVAAISASPFLGAAVKTDGTVWVWGDTTLGSNTFTVSTTPIKVNGIANVSAISAGEGHLLMLSTDKTVWAMGANSRGQLGDGTTTNRPSPVQVVGLTNVTRIAAGEDEFSLALKEDGTIWAWGNNFSGQLGPGGGNLDFSPHANPVQVTSLPAGMTNISAGGRFCLALAGDGTVWSWGDNSSSQLGQGTSVSQNPIPKQIPNFGNVSAIDAGGGHSVALKNDGSIWTWGNNFFGQLGDGTTSTHLAPAHVLNVQSVSSPVMSPPGGQFFAPIDVMITTATPGAVIHFTTNGITPTENDPVVPANGIHMSQGGVQITVRAWKPGLFPSSTITGSFGISTPVQHSLTTEQNGLLSNQLAALDSMTLQRDPFPVINPANLLKNPADPNTRVMIFVLSLQLGSNETAANITVRLTDANGVVYDVAAEHVNFTSNMTFSQLTFRLPNDLAPGTCQVQVIVHQLVSNVGVIRIKP